MEISSLIISILSLFATVSVSFAIYWLQRRHEKEIQIKEGQIRLISIKEKAKNFLIDFEEERDYLPYCIFASSLNRNIKHNRKIYTSFNRLSDEIQAEVLNQANIKFNFPIKGKWLDQCIELIKLDIKKFDLGKDHLYDGAKYFHRGFYNWKDYTIPEDLFFFKISDLNHIKYSLYEYINTYAGNKYLKSIGEDGNSFYPTGKPFDIVWNEKNLANIDEDICCAWVINLLSNTALVFAKSPLYKDKINDFTYDLSTDAQIETLEDLYYDAVKMLYMTYAEKNRVNPN